MRTLKLGLSDESNQVVLELPGNGIEVPVACFECEMPGVLEVWFSPMKPRATIRNGWTVRPKADVPGAENLASVLLEVLCPDCSMKRKKELVPCPNT